MRLLPLLFLAACAVDEPSFSEAEQEIKKLPDNCPTYDCGGNSAGLDGRYVTAIQEKGVTTPEGMRLVDFGRYVGTSWRSSRADVLNAELLARDKNTNAITEYGPDLVGFMFIVEDTTTTNRYNITVVRAEKTAMWAQYPNPGRKSWNYELSYTSDKNPQDPQNVCMRPPSSDPMDPQMTVLFDDDRIDTDDIRFANEEADWFTFGCSGSALAKQHLSGHTKAGSHILGVTTTLKERTAFLKMLTADYCGAGTPYTVAGTRLHYRDRHGFMSTVSTGEAIEGVWGERGAICVGTPRVEFNPTPLSIDTFGYDIKDELAQFGCTLPKPCDPKSYATRYPFGEGLVLSTNYY